MRNTKPINLADAMKTKDIKERFKTILFGLNGTGKSKLAWSFPKAYILDTENLIQYDEFRKLKDENKSGHTNVSSLEEIKAHVLALLEGDHDYKTLVIDSFTNAYYAHCNFERQRLTTKTSDGSEFARHTTTAKGISFDICQLLNRLDMNVILIAREKDKYENEVAIGKIPDISEKASHDLGGVIRTQNRGKDNFVGIVMKSRYKGKIDINSTIELSYEYLVSKLGVEMFTDKSTGEDLATPDQVKEAKQYFNRFNVRQESINKFLTQSQSSTLEEVNFDKMEKLINHYKAKMELQNSTLTII